MFGSPYMRLKPFWLKPFWLKLAQAILAQAILAQDYNSSVRENFSILGLEGFQHTWFANSSETSVFTFFVLAYFHWSLEVLEFFLSKVSLSLNIFLYKDGKRRLN